MVVEQFLEGQLGNRYESAMVAVSKACETYCEGHGDCSANAETFCIRHVLELSLLLLLLQVEYFQSPGLSRRYSLVALDAEGRKAQTREEGEDRKDSLKKTKQNTKNPPVHILHAHTKSGGDIGYVRDRNQLWS